MKNIRRSHHYGDQPNFDIEQGLPHLCRLELHTTHAELVVPQALDGDKAFRRRQKPGVGRRARCGKGGDAQSERHTSGQQVDVLPWPQMATMDLGEAVVERPAGNCEGARATEPPALAQRLLALRVEAGHDAHKGGGDGALDEAQEEALSVETAPARDSGRQHADAGPKHDDGAEHAADGEPLQRKAHGVEPGEHTKVEERGSPAEARRGRGQDAGGRVNLHDREAEVACHAKERCRA